MSYTVMCYYLISATHPNLDMQILLYNHFEAMNAMTYFRASEKQSIHEIELVVHVSVRAGVRVEMRLEAIGAILIHDSAFARVEEHVVSRYLLHQCSW